MCNKDIEDNKENFQSLQFMQFHGLLSSQRPPTSVKVYLKYAYTFCFLDSFSECGEEL